MHKNKKECYISENLALRAVLYWNFRQCIVKEWCVNAIAVLAFKPFKNILFTWEEILFFEDDQDFSGCTSDESEEDSYWPI